jgi:serine/threonine-protein kinase
MQASLLGKAVGGWLIDKAHGYGKSAVVMGAIKDGVRGAVKIFHPELVELFGRETQLERIRREMSLIGFKHPNLVKILDGGDCQATGYLFVVMEELTWKNLREELKSIPPDKTRSIIRQLAEAAKALESRGLVHRDIKPENIAVSSDFNDVKLLDLGVLRPFGISALTDQNSRPFIGTLRYSSPEYLQRKEEDTPEGWRALTIYQIGAVLHDLLMREELFADDSEPYPILVQAVISGIPEVHGDDVELVRLCKYCLVKLPETRLSLVDWDSFSFGSNAIEVSPHQIRERIKARQTYSLDLMGGAGIAGGEARRLLAQLLEKACGALSLRLAVLLVDKCFPLHSITPLVDAIAKTCTCNVHFESSESLGLLYPIHVALRLTLIDENLGNQIYRLDGRAEVFTASTSQILAADLAVGELSPILSDVTVENWLLLILEAAYESLDQTGK